MFDKVLPTDLSRQVYCQTEKRADEKLTLTLNMKQLARELNISDKTARNLAHTPGFPSFRIGNRVLINRKALELWIDQQTLKRSA